MRWHRWQELQWLPEAPATPVRARALPLIARELYECTTRSPGRVSRRTARALLLHRVWQTYPGRQEETHLLITAGGRRCYSLSRSSWDRLLAGRVSRAGVLEELLSASTATDPYDLVYAFGPGWVARVRLTEGAVVESKLIDPARWSGHPPVDGPGAAEGTRRDDGDGSKNGSGSIGQSARGVHHGDEHAGKRCALLLLCAREELESTSAALLSAWSCRTSSAESPGEISPELISAAELLRTTRRLKRVSLRAPARCSDALRSFLRVTLSIAAALVATAAGLYHAHAATALAGVRAAAIDYAAAAAERAARTQATAAAFEAAPAEWAASDRRARERPDSGPNRRARRLVSAEGAALLEAVLSEPGAFLDELTVEPAAVQLRGRSARSPELFLQGDGQEKVAARLSFHRDDAGDRWRFTAVAQNGSQDGR